LHKPAHILLVEDDEQVRVLVEDVLRDAGYQVSAATDVATALTLLERDTYDLLLTDGRLPDGSGFTIARIAAERDIKVLVYTGYGMEFSDEERARYPVLAKPVRVSELLLVVGHFLGKKPY